jgi:hypothetical protein
MAAITDRFHIFFSYGNGAYWHIADVLLHISRQLANDRYPLERSQFWLQEAPPSIPLVGISSRDLAMVSQW